MKPPRAQDAGLSDGLVVRNTLDRQDVSSGFLSMVSETFTVRRSALA
jgi:hypothetical protein